MSKCVFPEGLSSADLALMTIIRDGIEVAGLKTRATPAASYFAQALEVLKAIGTQIELRQVVEGLIDQRIDAIVEGGVDRLVHVEGEAEIKHVYPAPAAYFKVARRRQKDRDDNPHKTGAVIDLVAEARRRGIGLPPISDGKDAATR